VIWNCRPSHRAHLLNHFSVPCKTEFLYNLFADPDIIRLPGPLSLLQNTIALFIAKRRAPKSRAAYESIGGGSPILKYSNAQADLVAQSLQERYGLSVETYIGMRYWKPFTDEALEAIRKDKINALVILPLYPQFSISTSGSSLRVLQEEFSKHPSRYGNMVHTVVPSWYDRPGYIRAMCNLIQIELDSFIEEEIAEAKAVAPDRPPLHILFSAHGVPKSYIEAGDPYQKQMEQCVEGIKAALYEKNSPEHVEVHLSYQSRVGPIEWLRPYTDDVLPELGESGVRNLVVVPISFVSEHIETLEEIDIEYRELAQESGITNWRRCPAPNTDPIFIQDMADMVYEALIEPTQTVTEACVANNIEGVDLASVDEAVVLTVGGVGGVGADGDLYQVERSLQSKERINARAAMAGVLLTIMLELLSGQPLTHFLGFK
jgi:ferrochelatase